MRVSRGLCEPPGGIRDSSRAGPRAAASLTKFTVSFFPLFCLAVQPSVRKPGGADCRSQLAARSQLITSLRERLAPHSSSPSSVLVAPSSSNLLLLRDKDDACLVPPAEALDASAPARDDAFIVHDLDYAYWPSVCRHTCACTTMAYCTAGRASLLSMGGKYF